MTEIRIKNLSGSTVTIADLYSQEIAFDNQVVIITEFYDLDEIRGSTDLIQYILDGDIAVYDSTLNELTGSAAVQEFMGTVTDPVTSDGRPIVESTQLVDGYEYIFRSHGDLDNGGGSWTKHGGESLSGSFAVLPPHDLTNNLVFSEDIYVSAFCIMCSGMPVGASLDLDAVAPAGMDLGNGPLGSETVINSFLKKAYIQGDETIKFEMDKAFQVKQGVTLRLNVTIPSGLVCSYHCYLKAQVPKITV